jgi:hypothetical protein
MDRDLVMVEPLCMTGKQLNSSRGLISLLKQNRKGRFWSNHEEKHIRRMERSKTVTSINEIIYLNHWSKYGAVTKSTLLMNTPQDLANNKVENEIWLKRNSIGFRHVSPYTQFSAHVHLSRSAFVYVEQIFNKRVYNLLHWNSKANSPHKRIRLTDRPTDWLTEWMNEWIN